MKKHHPWAALLIVGAICLTACDDADEPEPSPSASTTAPTSPSPSTEPVASATPTDPGPCPNEAEAVADPSLKAPGSFEGPVTASDSEDSVWVTIDLQGDEGCLAFVVVETAAGELLSTPVNQDGVMVGQGFPRIASLVRVDERPGADIVLNMLAGASTEFLAVFSAGSGDVERLTLEGGDPYGDLFPSGGSVGHLEASDCASDVGEAGSIVVSSAVPQGDGYKVVRRFYRSSDGVFSLEDTERIPIDDDQDIEQFQEFLTTPFGLCPQGT